MLVIEVWLTVSLKPEIWEENCPTLSHSDDGTVCATDRKATS
jgi:hypothetical protein